MVSALHANQKESAWVECDGGVSSQLTMYNSPASSGLLPEILEAGVPILMFAGAEDLICNYKGIENICDGLIWDGKKGMGVSWRVKRQAARRFFGLQAYTEELNDRRMVH